MGKVNNTSKLDGKKEGPFKKLKKIKKNQDTTIMSQHNIEATVRSWIFQGKVVCSSELREVTLYKQSNSIFYFDISDATGTIRCVSKNKTAESLFKLIKIGMIIQLQKVHLQSASEQYNTTGNKYELEITPQTIIEELEVDAEEADNMKDRMKVTNFNDIDDASLTSAINVVAIIKKVEDVSDVQMKDGKIIQKRNVLLIDDLKNKINLVLIFLLSINLFIISRCFINFTFQILLTCWGDLAQNLNWRAREIVTLKGVGVGAYNGIRSLKLYKSTVVSMNDDNDESKRYYIKHFTLYVFQTIKRFQTPKPIGLYLPAFQKLNETKI
uniref:OB domain-containing protein n=1 Tax=Trichogramma kaykai TaxID=54128 RepID=A0ABD2WDC2_9HYME